MQRIYPWLAYTAFAVCLVGIVAWPLWSDNDLWFFAFGAIAAVVMVPVVLVPGLRAIVGAMHRPDKR